MGSSGKTFGDDTMFATIDPTTITRHCSMLPRLRLDFSDIGKREENQDRVHYLLDEHSGDGLWVVADGMGGHRGGSIAAEAVVAAAETCWNSRSEHESGEAFLSFLVSEAHRQVQEEGKKQGLTPRSTLVALYKLGDSLHSVHVGDCRVMQYNREGFVKRTIDHSIAQLHVLQGKITEDEMARHPDQNKLITNVGGEDDPEPEFETWNLEKGAYFYLCSDGFWELFQKDELIPGKAGYTRWLNDEIKNRIAAEEKHDNTTVLFLDFNEGGAKKSSINLPITIGAGVIIFGATLYFLLADPLSSKEPQAQQSPGAPVVAPPAPIPEQTQASLPAREAPQGEVIDIEVEQAPEIESKSEAGKSEAGKNDPDTKDVEVEQELSKDEVAALLKPRIQLEDNSDIKSLVEAELLKRGLLDPESRLINVSDDALGSAEITRFQQSFRDLPVHGAHISLSIKNNIVGAIFGTVYSDIELPKFEPMTEEALAQEVGIDLEALSQDPSMLVFPLGNEFRLAWKYDEGRVHTIVDAISTEILFTSPTIMEDEK
jgi:serine/threonine protein phosphatase PrpC